MNEATIPNLGCIDRSDAIKEQTLFGPYLSNDLETISNAAEKAGGGMFLALATASLAKRREAAQKWRGKALQEAARLHERLNQGTAHLESDFLRDAYEGKVTLCEFESTTLHALQVASQVKLERKRASILGVREYIRSLHFDGGGKPKDIPSDMIILQDGSLTFHSNTSGAKAYGRSTGLAFFHCRLDRSSGRFHELPEGHCAGDELLKAGGSCGCPGSTDAGSTDTGSTDTGSTDPEAPGGETVPHSDELPLSAADKAPESPASSDESENKPSPGL